MSADPKPLVIWGASGHAKVLREFLCPELHRLTAVFDNAANASPFEGVPFYRGNEGFVEWVKKARPDLCAGIVAIGGARGLDRVALQLLMRDHGLELIRAIHPTAFVARDAVLGEGCQVLIRAVVGVEVQMGAACIINTAASVDHECILEDGVHVAPGATLTGCVKVGRYSMIAAGAVVLPRIIIGANAIVGAGSVVTRDVPDNAVVVGSPARVVRYQTPLEA
jgi:sugar O-acyltransferase (sialic acid O-acetyltransferase NeuD family)